MFSHYSFRIFLDEKLATELTGGYIKEMKVGDKRKGLQKLLGELPSHKRQLVEEIFRREVNVRRERGEFVSEQEEINIYVKAIGELERRKLSKESAESERKEGEKEHTQRKEERKDGRRSKEQRNTTEKEKSNLNMKTTIETEVKGKSSCNGKISLEGLSMAEKRLRVQKAMDELPLFVSSKIKSKQKLTVTKMKSEGKPVGEREEVECMADVFNHMFNEEGNIMAQVLKDHIFERKSDYRLKKDCSLKQLNLPEFDEQVRLFRNFDSRKQAEEMKTLRENLSVLLKILLFKKQDKALEDAEKRGVTLSKLEKNIIRYQILLDMTQAVASKREEKQNKSVDASTKTYQAEKQESGDEFDDDVRNSKDKEEASRKDNFDTNKNETSGISVNDDSDDDVIIIEDPELTADDKDEGKKNQAEVITDDKDEGEKNQDEVPSDDDNEVDIEGYDEPILPREIKSNSEENFPPGTEKEKLNSEAEQPTTVNSETVVDGKSLGRNAGDELNKSCSKEISDVTGTSMVSEVEEAIETDLAERDTERETTCNDELNAL